MVCDTGPPGNYSEETVWIGAGAFKRYLAGDWMRHLNRSIEHVDHIVPHRMLIGLNPWWFLKETHNLKPGMIDSRGMVFKVTNCSPSQSYSY